MRLLHFSLNGEPIRIGAERPDGTIVDLARAAEEAGLAALPTSIDGLLANRLLARAASLIDRAPSSALTDLSGARIHSPLIRPGKIIGVGLNYADHAAEATTEIPPEPVFFAKFANAVTGPFDPILLPSVSQEIDWEAELAVVVGRTGRDIPEREAMAYVAGYTVANDISARDWQMRKPLRQWTLGKTFDTFLPLGPRFVTADEIPDPYRLRLTCEVSGEPMQDALTMLHFSIPALIAYVSQVMTLEPGDIFLTGTPAGVGMSRTPPRYLRDGDRVVTSIDGLGTMSNPVRNRS
jgi:2-keto-4-pentenoate hydratase/2-oxohepta-3-ene-1,7-dioic acid hydratase in catechol pathway